MRKGATKHCSWGLCKSDSRFPENLPPGTEFIRFPKPGKIKKSMTKWEEEQQMQRTEKAKRWVHACGRKNFTVDKIRGHTYICSLHFIGGKGPTIDNPEPLNAKLTEIEIVRKSKKRKANPVLAAKKMATSLLVKTNDTTTDSDILFTIEPLMNSTFVNNDRIETENTPISLNLSDANNYSKNEESSDICDANLHHKSTQTMYYKYMLGAKIETVILRHELVKEKQEKINSSENFTNVYVSQTNFEVRERM